MKRAAPARLYGRVCRILESARAGAARSVNTAQVVANWMIGREIVEEEQKGSARAGYAERLVEQLSVRLSRDFGPGYSTPNLWHMRRFHLVYPVLLSEDEILYAVRRESQVGARGKLKIAAGAGKDGYGLKNRENIGENEILYAVRRELGAWKPGQLNAGLSWTHYRSLLKIDREQARSFYEIEAVRNAWSARELERQIGALLFERLAKSRNKKGLIRLAVEGQTMTGPADLFKDPTVIEFLGLPESDRLVESDLEKALIGNLQQFLLELGTGFAFVARQQRLTLDGDHFYIDLVFYHVLLKCYVLIDLKVGKLTHADLGQIRFYVNYFDREKCTEGDNPTLGLVLCSDKNDAVVKYTLAKEDSRQIFASRYQLHLPSENQLQEEMRREMRQLTAAPDPLPPSAAKSKSSAGARKKSK